MPNLQALEAVPSFGSQLGQALGGGLSQGISTGLNEMLQQKKQRQYGKSLAEYLGQPEMATQLGQLPSDIQKEIAKSHFRQKQEQGLQNEEYGNILDTMEGLLNEGLAGRSANIQSYINPELRETTARFESLGTSLLGLAQKVALKAGIRNQREFQTFLDRTIPNANDTVDTARGKINALRSYLSESGSKSTSNSSSQKAENGKKLSEEGAKKILKKAGGDPKKATEMAEKLGYKF